MLKEISELIAALLIFWQSISFFLLGGTYADAPAWFRDLPTHAQTHLFSLSLIFKLWNEPHYRSGTFQHDMLKNLRNVAVPRTGMPLSVFCGNKLVALAFVLVAYPLMALVAAIHAATSLAGMVEIFREQLLTPRDWFSLWRLNCRLASFHSGKTKAAGYKMEDKFTFLLAAEAAEVPVSPFMNVGEVVVKDKNEEGGMGIYFFKNARHGGDWIIQERLQNDDFVSSMLPSDAPLSTFRVITSSRGGGLPCSGDMVVPLSCVFRAGRAGASTDHKCLMFDVDLQTGVIGKGTTNSHWYQLGAKGLRTAWSSTQDQTHHPDCGVKICGRQVPDIQMVKDLCINAHEKLLPDVPMAGWDVALTNKGALLLETNLSCNFFRGTFDEDYYFNMVHEYFMMLDSEDDCEVTLGKQKILNAGKGASADAQNNLRMRVRA
jgi:hypothetical protein